MPYGFGADSLDVYRRQTGAWVSKQMLNASNWAADDFFGIDVDFEGDPARGRAMAMATTL